MPETMGEHLIQTVTATYYRTSWTWWVSEMIKSLLGKGKGEVELGELCEEHRAYGIIQNSQRSNTNKKEELPIYDQHYF